LGLVAACDIVIAEENTSLCFSECRLGILPAVVSSFVLPKVGLGQVRRLYLTAQVFDSRLAKEIGLVHEVVPKSALDARTDQYIQDILRCAPGAVRKAKGYLRKMVELSRPRRLRFSVETLVRARASSEGREGFAAFLEKRPANWVLQG
jgi:methylglutaconyl-CoA hydratase